MRLLPLIAALLLLAAPSVATAKQLEAHYKKDKGTATGAIEIIELHALYDDDARRLAVRLRFSKPLPQVARVEWTASTWRDSNRTTCGNSVDTRLSISGDAIYGFWQPGLMTVVMNIESASISRDRRTVKTTITENMADRDFRCVRAYVTTDGSKATRPIAFDLPIQKLTVAKDEVLGRTSKRPGRTTLITWATDGTKVRLVVTHRGRRTFARRFTSVQGKPVRKRFNWSCKRPGTYRFLVKATDAYGDHMTRRGSWEVSQSRCDLLASALTAKR